MHVAVPTTILVGLVLALGALAVLLALVVVNRQSMIRGLRRSEQSFRDLYENISDGVFRSTLDGRMISANPALVRLNGFASEREMLDEVNDIAGKWYVDPNRRAEIHRILEEHGRVTNLISEVYRYKTRERIWIEESTRLVRDENTGRPRYYDGTVREVTDTVRRLQLQERYDRISSVVGGCLYQLRVTPDMRASFIYASEGLTKIYGLRPAEVMKDASLTSALVHPDDIESVKTSFARSFETLQPRTDEYRIRTIEGVEKWVLGHAVPEKEPDGSVVWHGYIIDVTERKRAEQRIYDLAYSDTLTGLPNRAALIDRLRQVFATGGARWSALLFIDLDQFKVLNDSKGHQFGDLLLCGVAERLKPVVGERDVVARLGGDEFVILVRDVGPSHSAAELQARRIADRIHSTIADPFVIDGMQFHTSASVGVALFCGENEIGVDELLKRADMAMYKAKASGRGATAHFEPGMQRALDEQLALTTEFRDALEGGALKVVYQPQVDGSGAWFGVEALLRWEHPTRGHIEPATFIPLAERAGLGAQVDAFVLGQVCAVLRRWRDRPGLDQLQLSVNVGNQRLDKSLAALVINAIRATAADPTRLTIELTERVMFDDLVEVEATLVALKKLGVKIALDDFGTGYSSLSHLKRLPIDTLKIDRSFVADIETDTNDRVIVQTILNIARNLGVGAIAEGVETEMQALLLRRFGCHAFQGYMYGRPMSLEEIESQVVPDETGKSRRAV